MCHSGMCVEELTGIWQRVAIQLLGDGVAAVRLTPGEYARLGEALAAQCHSLGGTPIVLDGGDGYPAIPDDWPAGQDGFVVEVEATASLYLAVVGALRIRWAEEVGGPLRLGGLDTAARVEATWLQE